MHHWNRALITGASSGIGEAIARRLAHRGTSLVLVARREERLRQLVAEFGGTGHEVLVADLTDATARDRVARRLAASAEPIDLLVNNAGFGVAGRFHERTTDEVQAQLDVLVTTVLELTHAAVPGMVSRGTGGVLNVSSLAANVPFPGSAVYNASKAFVSSFSESLHGELAGSGVSILVSEPGLVQTEFQAVAGMVDRVRTAPRWLWLDADRVARDSLAALEADDVIHRTALPYRLATSLTSALPRRLVRRWVAAIARRSDPNLPRS